MGQDIHHLPGPMHPNFNMLGISRLSPDNLEAVFSFISNLNASKLKLSAINAVFYLGV